MRVGIIGAGVIGSGFARALDQPLLVYDRNPEKIPPEFAAESLAHLVQESEVVVIAIRPSGLADLAAELTPLLRPNTMIVSVLAGALTETLQGHFPGHPVVHLMPNLPFRVGKGVLAVEDHPSLGKGDCEQVEALFSPLGTVIWLRGDQMRGVAAIAGSAPAFIALVIESLVDGAIGIGFSAKEALPIVLQMVEGTVSLLREEGISPGQFAREVAVPSGSTIEGMRAFEACGGRSALIEAVYATRNKEH